MGKCEVCGNEYSNTMEIIKEGKKHIFDSFECAIHELAPVCAHCGCKIIGHGVETGGKIYCCNHCAGIRKSSDKDLDLPTTHVII